MRKVSAQISMCSPLRLIRALSGFSLRRNFIKTNKYNQPRFPRARLYYQFSVIAAVLVRHVRLQPRVYASVQHGCLPSRPAYPTPGSALQHEVLRGTLWYVAIHSSFDKAHVESLCRLFHTSYELRSGKTGFNSFS